MLFSFHERFCFIKNRLVVDVVCKKEFKKRNKKLVLENLKLYKKPHIQTFGSQSNIGKVQSEHIFVQHEKKVSVALKKRIMYALLLTKNRITKTICFLDLHHYLLTISIICKKNFLKQCHNSRSTSFLFLDLQLSWFYFTLSKEVLFRKQLFQVSKSELRKSVKSRAYFVRFDRTSMFSTRDSFINKTMFVNDSSRFSSKTIGIEMTITTS